MNRARVTTLAAACLGVFLASGQAGAQSTPYQRSPVSPYINLTQRGTSPGINYYGIVRPELEIRGSIRQLEQRQAQTSQDIATQQQTSALPPTGHPAYFMNESTFFMTLGSSRVPARPSQPPPRLPTSSALTRSPGR